MNAPASRHRGRAALVVLSSLFLLPCSLFPQGNLTPPGAPTPTMKTLTEVEPRIAVNATNTPGDAGCLFKITQPGSYYLTGNIAGVSGKDGIQINASGVTLDLNGFELLGAPGSGNGVYISVGGVALTNIAVTNGSIRNWGGAGMTTVFGGYNFRVTGILVSGNLGSGIKLTDISSFSPNFVACTVSHCTAANNSGDFAISVGNGSAVSDCSLKNNNTSYGIFAREGSTVSNCSLHFNQGHGINVNTGTVTNCSVYLCQNSGGGIIAGFSTISNCSSVANTAFGILAGNGSTVIKLLGHQQCHLRNQRRLRFHADQLHGERQRHRRHRRRQRLRAFSVHRRTATPPSVSTRAMGAACRVVS